MTEKKKIRLTTDSTKLSRVQLELDLQQHKHLSHRLSQQNEQLVITNAKLKEELFLFLSSIKKTELQEDKEVQLIADSVAKQNTHLHKKCLTLTKELVDTRDTHSREIQKLELQLSEAETIARQEVNNTLLSELEALRKSSQEEVDTLRG